MKNIRTKLVNILGAALLMTMIMATGVRAASTRETITLRENYIETNISITRSLKESFVTVRCISVYPTIYYKDEQYTKIRTCLRFFDHNQLSDFYTLIEGEHPTYVEIYEGYLDRKSMYLIFTGNSKKSAEARVEYDPN